MMIPASIQKPSNSLLARAVAIAPLVTKFVEAREIVSPPFSATQWRDWDNIAPPGEFDNWSKWDNWNDWPTR